MNKFNFSFLIVLILISIISCKKDSLPKATHKGANTFGCKVDGVIFKPYFTGGLFNNVNVLSVGNSRKYNIFVIHAQNQETDQSISIEFTFIRQSGTYQLRQYPYRGIYDAGKRDPGWYTTDSLNTGELILTHCDTVKGIYSGKFFFTAKEANAGRIVKITEGRFDLKE